jgi:hypothetical protein
VSAATATFDLLRCALLAKLAADLGDPALTRRAALEAAGHARLLAGRGHTPEAATALPEVDDLLLQLAPPRVHPLAGLLPDDDLYGRAVTPDDATDHTYTPEAHR